MVLIAYRQHTGQMPGDDGLISSLYYHTDFWRVWQYSANGFQVQAHHSGIGRPFFSKTVDTLDAAMALVPKEAR